MSKKYKVGYTQGVFDMFHIGHLNIINRAKTMCDYLVVGVNSDELVEEYKHKTPVIHETNRAEIVRNIKAVDECIIVSTLDKMEIYKTVKFDAVFIGDGWKNNERWNKTEQQLSEVNVPVIYLPQTPEVSSTILKKEVPNRVEEYGIR
jgi:glycerol-3-phosphate cytidylyltransferase